MPLWRDVRVLSIAFQLLVLAAVLLVGAFLVGNLLTAMDERGFFPSFDFLDQTARFDIAEHYIPYESSDTYGRALVVGLINTLVVSIAGIIIATLVGLVVGIARLSSNWLLDRLALAYVELFRNTPLLLQLIVIYFAFFLQLPRPQDAIVLPGPIYISRSGLDLASPELTATGVTWLAIVAIAFVVTLGLWLAARRAEDAGRSGRGLRWGALIVVIAAPVIAFVLLPEAPIRSTEPVLGRFRFEGGVAVSAEFAALTLGLALYTAAFIAEIIRGAIESVGRGQVEAARAIGLQEGQTLRLVVLPQALRVIVPPLTSQYLNLIKNSSLAVVLGFQDVFGISKTITTQTGQPISVLFVVMGFYLAISLITSVLMNVYNRRVQIKER